MKERNEHEGIQTTRENRRRDRPARRLARPCDRGHRDERRRVRRDGRWPDAYGRPHQPGHFGADRHLPRADACRLPREAHRDADDARPCGSQAAGCRHPREERALTWRSATSLPSKTAKSASNRSEEHTSELQSLMRISYAVFCLKKKKNIYILQFIHK